MPTTRPLTSSSTSQEAFSGSVEKMRSCTELGAERADRGTERPFDTAGGAGSAASRCAAEPAKAGPVADLSSTTRWMSLVGSAVDVRVDRGEPLVVAGSAPREPLVVAGFGSSSAAPELLVAAGFGAREPLVVSGFVIGERRCRPRVATGAGAVSPRLSGVRSAGAKGMTSLAPPMLTSTSMNSGPTCCSSRMSRTRPAAPSGNWWVGLMPTRTDRPAASAARAAGTSNGAYSTRVGMAIPFHGSITLTRRRDLRLDAVSRSSCRAPPSRAGRSPRVCCSSARTRAPSAGRCRQPRRQPLRRRRTAGCR